MRIGLIIMVLLLTGCSLGSVKTLTLSTDIPEFSAYVEYFNRSQNRYRVEIHYKSKPEPENKQSNTDILIFKNLASKSNYPYFLSLGKILNEKEILPTLFYPGLLQNGYYKEKPVLLPLSFSLPMIIFNKASSEGAQEISQSLIIPLKTIREKSVLFQPKSRKEFGFSPFWEEEFPVTLVRLMGSGFSAGESGEPVFSQEQLNETVSYLRAWIGEIDGGYDKINHFSTKYMNAPSYKILSMKKILYYFSSSETLFQIPKEQRNNIEFRWLSKDQKIPVNDDIVYAGILKRAKNQEGCLIFLKWLFSPVVQSRLIEINKYKRISGIFGIAGKFSSIIEVNEKYIPKQDAVMVGHIPQPDFLSFPPLPPDNWQKIKKGSLIPYLKNSTLSAEEIPPFIWEK